MDRAIPSSANASPEITMTIRDHARLERLLREHAPIRSWKAVAFLIGEMGRAKIVPDDEIGHTVVTIHTRVAFREGDGDSIKVVALTLPGERELYPDGMSVLTSIGAALVGLSEGQSMAFAAPDGRARTVTVDKVLYQPQAARLHERQVARRFVWEHPTE